MFSKISSNWSLRRSTFIYTGITFLVIGLGISEFARQNNVHQYYLQSQQNAEILTSAIAAASHYDILSSNSQALDNIVTRLVGSVPDVQAVAMYSANNKLLASWNRDIIYDHDKSVSSYEKNVSDEGKNIGRILVAFDVSKQKQILTDSAIRIYTSGLLIIIFCAMLILATLNHIVVNPVRRIHEHLIKLQNNENPGDLKIAANKELFYLGNTVNELGNVLELRKQKENAIQETSKAKSDFLANMSHELRTPINGVLGMLTLLSETSLDPQQTEQVRIASSSSKNLLTLVNDILDFSKLEAGKLRYEKIEFELETLIEECAEALSESAFRKDLIFLCQIDPDVPVHALGDPTRLRQLITNLAGNAIKFTSSGVVRIHVQRHNKIQSSDQIKFSISDTGIGINQNVLNSLFTSFAQADTSTTRKYGGTGLGLAISRRIVEGMDGQIGVNSVENEGSTFWFTLQLPPANNQTVLSANHLKLDQPIKVLLVEHVEEAKDNLTQLLLEQNTQVDHANGAKEALQKITQSVHTGSHYDVVLFTTSLNDMSARQFCNHISEQENWHDLKLIAINKISQAHTNLYTHTNDRVSTHISKPARRSAMASALAIAVSEHSENYATPDVDELIDEQSWQSVGIGSGKYKQSALSDESELQKTTSNHLAYERITILVADDNLINQQVAQGMLDKLGFQTLLADNGRIALDVLNTEQVDLVLMDCQMPVLDGFETTKQIRSEESGSRLPIIALTANATQSDADQCFAAGMDGFLTKPIDIKVFEQTLLSMLGDRLHEDHLTEHHNQKAA